jgi:hypothetical protein
MKKLLRVLIHNRKKIGKGILLGVAALVAFDIAHQIGTVERGYEAIGGEIFIPFLIVFAPAIWQEIKESFGEVDEDVD